MGLEYKKISELTSTGAGGTPLKRNKEYYENGSIPWLLSGEVGQKEIFEAKKFISELGLNNSSAKMFPQDTVLVAMYGATAGEVGIFRFPSTTNQAVCGILPSENLLPEFVYYFFLFHKENLVAQAIGNAQPNISQIKIRNTLIPALSHKEQKQIVAILDQAFEKIEQARATVEKNLQNARELFESYLHSVFEPEHKNWSSNQLVEITSKIGSGATPRGGKSSYKTEGISLVRSLNVHDRWFKEKNLAFIDHEQAEKLSNVELEDNDVLLNITGASVARCCLMPRSYLPARVNQHVSIIRPKKDQLIPKFLNYLLTSKTYKDQLLQTGEKGGSTRQAITKAQIENFKISYPKEVTDQKRIVSELDVLVCETKKLETIYQQKLNCLEELKKSILQKAFSGELTANDNHFTMESSV